jgi:hypothetical protein
MESKVFEFCLIVNGPFGLRQEGMLPGRCCIANSETLIRRLEDIHTIPTQRIDTCITVSIFRRRSFASVFLFQFIRVRKQRFDALQAFRHNFHLRRISQAWSSFRCVNINKPDSVTLDKKARLLDVELDKEDFKILGEALGSFEVIETLDAGAEEAGNPDRKTDRFYWDHFVYERNIIQRKFVGSDQRKELAMMVEVCRPAHLRSFEAEKIRLGLRLALPP